MSRNAVAGMLALLDPFSMLGDKGLSPVVVSSAPGFYFLVENWELNLTWKMSLEWKLKGLGSRRYWKNLSEDGLEVERIW
ncbi:hypothetical protein HD554DRAFT_2170279 [Boletus coccyginus]|nr:hypothetical protein HD554DRAFT_2170279 [Boletus coccyginus]